MKISIYCLFRDSAARIQNLFAQIEEIEAANIAELNMFFYENDSADNTKHLLKSFLNGRSGKLLAEQLGAKRFGSSTSPERMAFMCSCRNKCRSLGIDSEADYALVIDSDISFNSENLLRSINVLEKNKNIVMTTPNVRQPIKDLVFGESDSSYYDTYPVRDRRGNTGVYFCDCPLPHKDDRFQWKLGLLCKVHSAFGGFALVRNEAFKKCKWSADIHCDHVYWCYDLLEYGDIVIDPLNIVHSFVEENRIDMENFKSIATRQLQILQYCDQNLDKSL